MTPGYGVSIGTYTLGYMKRNNYYVVGRVIKDLGMFSEWLVFSLDIA